MHQSFPLALTLLMALAPVLRAQTPGPSNMDPSLGIAMPIELRNDQVILSRSIALAPSRLIPAGTILRNAFRIPEAADIKRATQGRKTTELEKTYGGRRTGISALDPDTRTEFERTLAFLAKQSPWNDLQRFRAMFHALPTDQYFLTLQATPDATPEPLQLSFPLDLLLAQENNSVRVLAVTLDSAAARAGITPGSIILTIGSTPVQGSLDTLLKALPRERRTAQQSTGQLSLTIQQTPDASPRTVHLRLPRSLSNPNDFFSDLTATPPDSSTAPEPSLPPSAPSSDH